MKIPFFQVDAFSRKVSGGNPAAVCVLPSWVDDETLQSIAAENNLLGERVKISGYAVLYAEGYLYL